MNYFNFRHVIMRVGIPSTNETNWAVGQMLVALAAKRGIELARILTEKTSPDPSVAAPHVIAHYPMSLFEEAVKTISDWWGDSNRQEQLPF